MSLPINYRFYYDCILLCVAKKCGAVDHNIDFAIEWLCSVLVRHVGSLEENLLPRLHEAQQFLATLDRDDYFNCIQVMHLQ